MKRTAAVLGPTPPFLRWAIKHECPLRDIDVDNLADQTFRQLRNLRELSAGYQDRRVFQGICVHPAPIGDASQLRAFHADEVFDYFGDRESLGATCGNCQANSGAQLDTDWAGCFGLLPVNLNFTFGHTSTPNVLPHDSLETLIDSLIGQPLAFYKLWTSKWIAADAVDRLAAVFRRAADQRPGHPALAQFADACRQCVDHKMELFVELVPAGFSDGVQWRIVRACQQCRYHSDQPREKGTPCPVCGSRHADDSGRKAKVLGLRPYLLFQRVVGQSENEKFIQQYRRHLIDIENQKSDSDHSATEEPT